MKLVQISDSIIVNMDKVKEFGMFENAKGNKSYTIYYVDGTQKVFVDDNARLFERWMDNAKVYVCY